MSDFKLIQQLEARLWSAADNLRANSGLTAQEYSRPVQGLIFLRHAEYRFTEAKKRLEKKATSRRRRAGGDIKTSIQAEGAMFVPEDALPKTYTRFEDDILKDLLKTFAGIRFDLGTDVFGRIYEYFLNEFAKSEGQGGGEFFTPSPLVRLITQIIEPYHGKVFDPACGSGGMFVSSAAFVEEHNRIASDELSIFGQEKTGDTVRLSKMNLAVHGLQGDVREGNSYYEDIHRCTGAFDYVMANPPFNVDKIQKERLEDDKKRFPFGMPRNDNGNYIWIQMFYAALNDTGRAGFVMPNSASDARGSEQEIRQKLIQTGAVDVMVAVSTNFFYTVTLPCTLWFFDKNKQEQNKDKVLFIDARHIFRQVTRALRDYTSEQLAFIANIVKLYRGEQPDNTFVETHPDDYNDGSWSLESYFPDGKYQDIAGLCKVASLEEIEDQGWSLNAGRYVGVAQGVVQKTNLQKDILAQKNANLKQQRDMLLPKLISGQIQL